MDQPARSDGTGVRFGRGSGMGGHVGPGPKAEEAPGLPVGKEAQAPTTRRQAYDVCHQRQLHTVLVLSYPE